jgi:glycosyltransferase involved in cell wall biosynthesis
MSIDVDIVPFETLTRRMTILQSIGRFYSFSLTVWSLIALMRERAIELVHINSIAGLCGGIAASLLRVPVVWHVREILSESFINRWVIRIVGRLASRIIAVSQAVRHRLERGNVPSIKIAVIYNAVSIDQFQTEADRQGIRQELGLDDSCYVIGIVGKIHPRKGQKELIQACRIVLNYISNIKVFIVGDWGSDKDYKQELADLLRDEELSDRIIFTGVRPDVPTLVQAFDVLVQPSPYPDPLPRVVMEGMAAALPVIGSDVGGIPEEIVDHSTGLLVPPGDVKALADCIVYLADRPVLRKEMGMAGRKQAAERFDPVSHSQSIMQIYESALGGSG